MSTTKQEEDITRGIEANRQDDIIVVPMRDKKRTFEYNLNLLLHLYWIMNCGTFIFKVSGKLQSLLGMSENIC